MAEESTKFRSYIVYEVEAYGQKIPSHQNRKLTVGNNPFALF